MLRRPRGGGKTSSFSSKQFWSRLSFVLAAVAIVEAALLCRLSTLHAQPFASVANSSEGKLTRCPPAPLNSVKDQLQGQSQVVDEEPLEGIAVTLWLGSPKWFQNRYSMMIALVYAWLPPRWKIQVFYHPKNKMAIQATQFEGVQKLVAKGAVILTPLPEELHKKKRKDVLVSSWVWRNVAAEKVITFGGTSVICGNSPHTIDSFSNHLDYIGGPWASFGGLGGDAGLTYRNRTFMLATADGLATETGLSRRDTGKEDSEITSFWNDFLVMNRTIPYRLAQKSDTLRFAMGDLNDASGLPFGAIGTLAGLSEEQRIAALDFCPELKIFYPVLSHPSCFGASPKPVDCFKSLCQNGGFHCQKGASAVVVANNKNKNKRSGQSVTITFS